MNKQRLGGSEIEVAALALGGNVFGWTADEQRSFEVLDAFVAAGFNLIDTRSRSAGAAPCSAAASLARLP